ncbi:unnamed protein product [Paramecium octaurelia]|uniref:Uncharacterized protein n=1 Tax=Paramecium octaurelia TaxID=43137 RepID=A0A8S1WRI3_PAROT|nr:unnamed protein product [Paramecium octaurelia]
MNQPEETNLTTQCPNKFKLLDIKNQQIANIVKFKIQLAKRIVNIKQHS